MQGGIDPRIGNIHHDQWHIDIQLDTMKFKPKEIKSESQAALVKKNVPKVPAYILYSDKQLLSVQILDDHMSVLRKNEDLCIDIIADASPAEELAAKKMYKKCRVNILKQ